MVNTIQKAIRFLVKENFLVQYYRKMAENNLDIAMFRLTQYGDNELTKLVINHLMTAPQAIIQEIGEVICSDADDEIFEYFTSSCNFDPQQLDELLESMVLTFLSFRDEGFEPEEYLVRIHRLIDLGGNVNNITGGYSLIRRHLPFMMNLGYKVDSNNLIETLGEDDCVDIGELQNLISAGVDKHNILSQLGLF